MDISFSCLKNKDVVNICDGKNLGNITDIIIDTTCGKIIGIIVPSNKSFFSIFKSNNDIFIPYNRICKIGKDIVLVDIIMQENNNCPTQICCNENYIQNKSMENINIQQILKEIENNNEK